MNIIANIRAFFTMNAARIAELETLLTAKDELISHLDAVLASKVEEVEYERDWRLAVEDSVRYGWMIYYVEGNPNLPEGGRCSGKHVAAANEADAVCRVLGRDKMNRILKRAHFMKATPVPSYVPKPLDIAQSPMVETGSEDERLFKVNQIKEGKLLPAFAA